MARLNSPLHIMPEDKPTPVKRKAYSPRQKVMGILTMERTNGERETVIRVSLGLARKILKGREKNIRMALFTPYVISLKTPDKGN
jgi:hypothetical protein